MRSLRSRREHSGFPGPRSKPALMHAFAKNCGAASIREHLEHLRADARDSPDEFHGMCGIPGFALLHHDRLDEGETLSPADPGYALSVALVAAPARACPSSAA